MLRVPQYVSASRDLHVNIDLEYSYDITLHIRQYHARHWRTSTRQNLMHCDIWSMVYVILRSRTGRTLCSHQFGKQISFCLPYFSPLNP